MSSTLVALLLPIIGPAQNPQSSYTTFLFRAGSASLQAPVPTKCRWLTSGLLGPLLCTHTCGQNCPPETSWFSWAMVPARHFPFLAQAFRTPPLPHACSCPAGSHSVLVHPFLVGPDASLQSSSFMVQPITHRANQTPLGLLLWLTVGSTSF